MPVVPCFSYPADLPPGSGRISGYPCFAYPSDIPQVVSSPRRMPYSCFSYPLMFFSYPADVAPGSGNCDTAQPTSLEVRSMPYPCFRY
jgi:hypothetical protein